MKALLAPILLTIALYSCQEPVSIDPTEEIIEKADDIDMTPPADNSNVVVEGELQGASGHTTSGFVQIKQIDSSTKSLVITDFKTDNGPDLRFYLAEDQKATNFLELEEKVSNGNKSIVIPNNTDLEKKKFLLVWCKAFSVSFGYAELEKLEED